MAKIILSLEGMVVREIPLTKERTTIGRKPYNDIPIDNLAISGEHAVILLVHHDCFLEDLNSTNGTLVNGQPVKKQMLQNGDVIELGKYRLKYVQEAVAAQAKPDDFERTMIMRPGSDAVRPPVVAPAPSVPPTVSMPPAAGAPVSAPAAAPVPPHAGPPRGAIQLLSGSNAGKEMELTKNLTTLGKPGVQVAVIARRPHGYFITHVEGTNFPVVNGKTLDAQAHPLNDHDIVELAGVKMEFFFKT